MSIANIGVRRKVIQDWKTRGDSFAALVFSHPWKGLLLDVFPKSETTLEKQLSLYGWPVKTVFFTLVIVFLFLALQEQRSMCRMLNWLATCSKRSEVSSLSLLAALWVGWWRTFFLYKLFYAVEAQPPREFPLSGIQNDSLQLSMCRNPIFWGLL